MTKRDFLAASSHSQKPQGLIAMTVLHSGSNNKYSSNWNKVFQQAKPAEGPKSAPKKSVNKKTDKKK